MIAALTDFLSKIDVEKWVCIDVETISFDDKVAALYPYKGTRASTIIIGQGDNVFAVPIRHRTEKQNLFPFDEAVEIIRKFVASLKRYVNANAKFDMRVLAQDNIRFHPDCLVADTQVLARLVYNQHTALNLDYLTKYYEICDKKSDAAKQWIKANNTQDYGAIPIDILVPYGIADVKATIGLFNKLMTLLPEETKEQWDYECQFTRLLFECEDNGLKINKKYLMKKRIGLLQELIKINTELLMDVGNDKFNPNSHQQVAKLFVRLEVDPIKLTDEGEPSWAKEVLALVNKFDHGEKAAKIAQLLMELGELKIQESTFCAGWCEHADENSTVHPDFRQAGTRTGRLSCGDPNGQNFPDWMKEALVIPEGYVGIKWDLSQIEYRKFTHYSENERLLKSYEADPWVDYHQILADVLGLPRKPTKTINFGILYGMGKKKLKASLIKVIADNDSQRLRDSLQKFTTCVIPQHPDTISGELAASIAEGVIKEYHLQLPQIHKLNDQIKQILKVRGYVRNFYGRRIYLTPDKAYIALNAIIQGGCADFFKRVLVKVHKKCPNVYIVDNIHDADMSLMTIEHAQHYWDTVREVLKDSPYKVPILADAEICVGTWANYEKIDKDTNDVNAAYQKLLKRKAEEK